MSSSSTKLTSESRYTEGNKCILVLPKDFSRGKTYTYSLPAFSCSPCTHLQTVSSSVAGALLVLGRHHAVESCPVLTQNVWSITASLPLITMCCHGVCHPHPTLGPQVLNPRLQTGFWNGVESTSVCRRKEFTRRQRARQRAHSLEALE